MLGKFKLFFFFISICYFKSEAQTFYVSSPKNPHNITTGSDIYKVTLTVNGPVSELITNCGPNDPFFSIAMNKTGFYWIKSPYIYKADMNGPTLTNCHLLTDGTHSPALTIGPDQKAYYSSNYLYATDLNTLQTTNLGAMRYFPTGDMCFFNGNLYMAASQGIVKVDITDGSKSTLHFPIGQNLNLFGLVSVAAGLHKNTVYGLAYVNASKTDIIELDIENKLVIGVVGSLPYGVLDAASPVEDGSIIGIQLDKIEITQDCSAGNKAIVEVITKPHLEEFTYVLNGIRNTTGKFTGVDPGTYTVNITSASDQLSSTITVGTYNLQKPDYSWQRKNEMCGIPGEITFSSAETNSTYQISYNNNLFPVNNIFTGLNSGTSYHFEIINGNGCKVDAVDIPMLKDICKIELDQVQVQQQCDAFHKGIVKVLTKPHTYAYTYTLNGSLSNSTGIFENLNVGQYTIKITSSEDELEIQSIEVPDYKLTQPLITYNKNNPSCNLKGDIKFNIAGNSGLYNIQYQTDILPFDHLFTNLSPGIHRFVVSSQSGCLIDEYDVELIYQPCAVEITEVEVFAECDALGKAAIRVVCPPIPETYTYALDNGMTNSTGLFNMLEPGSYILNVTASGGGIPQTRTIIVPDYSLSKPQTFVNKTNPVCELPGQLNFIIRANPELYMIRHNSSTYPVDHTFTNLYAGNHHFSILKTDGCIVDNVDVQLIKEDCSEVFFPSAFSPNADGINDIFKANSNSKATKFKIQIYDRRGILLATSNELHNCWNGEYKGKPLPTAAYFWIATFTSQQNKPLVQKGAVTLIR